LRNIFIDSAPASWMRRVYSRCAAPAPAPVPGGADSPRSWVASQHCVLSHLRFQLDQQAHNRCDISQSTLPVGSSASTTIGRHDHARANAARLDVHRPTVLVGSGIRHGLLSPDQDSSSCRFFTPGFRHGGPETVRGSPMFSATADVQETDSF